MQLQVTEDNLSLLTNFSPEKVSSRNKKILLACLEIENIKVLKYFALNMLSPYSCLMSDAGSFSVPILVVLNDQNS